MEADGSRAGDVEGLFAAGLGDADGLAGAGADSSPTPCPSWPRPGHGRQRRPVPEFTVVRNFVIRIGTASASSAVARSIQATAIRSARPSRHANTSGSTTRRSP